MQYRRNLKFILIILLIAIIFGFMLSVSFWLFNSTFVQMEKKYIENFVGAFAGAFFAFIFVRLGNALSNIYDRHVQNYNALVQLEHHLNDCLNIIGDNYYECDVYIKAIEGMNSPDKIHLIMSRLEPIPIKKELLSSLIHIDLVNDLFSLNQHVRKLNEDMISFNDGYELIKKSFIELRISPEQYVMNAKSAIGARNNLKSFLLSAKDEIVQLAAAIRILLRDKPLLLSFVLFFAASHYDKEFKKKQAEEEVKIKKEIDEISKSSADRIRATLQNSDGREE